MFRDVRGRNSCDSTDLDELAVRAQQGDRSAAEALFHQLRPWIERTIASRQFDREDQKDITQEILHVLARKLPMYDGSRSFKAWAKVIINTTFIDYLRRRSPRSRAEDHWTVTETARLSNERDGSDELAFLVALRGCVDRIADLQRRDLVWGHVVVGLTAADLEHLHPDNRHMVRRWLKRDLQSVRRCLGLADPGSKETRP